MRKELSKKELEKIEDSELENWGRYLTDTQATKLEEELAVRIDHKALLKLMGYYHKLKRENDQNVQAHGDYIRILLQLVRSYPERTFFTDSSPNVRDEEMGEFVEVWRRHVDENPDDAYITGNAGLFLRYTDKELAVEYLKKAIELDPHDYVWSRSVCYMWSLQLEYMRMERFHLAQDLLYYGALDRNDADVGVSIARQNNLQTMCKAALALGRLKLAEKYARQHDEFVGKMKDPHTRAA
jgi:tetratricopeptide (TPR) repeat protein